MEVLPIGQQHLEYQNQSRYYNPSATSEELTHENSVMILSKKLEDEIRAAKRTHLLCGEVLLPCGLLQKISEDILNIADSELCGIRGCTLYLLFEGEEDCRRLSTVKIDPTIPSTFELYLTFKQANGGWGFLPQFLKKITGGGTVVISTEYELTKKKLYRPKST
ncbi:protein scylla-like isoform X1 [Coccinella septempunctata]|uniref:protein scylla-like isoform X1 n=2 Tax=Coccinella septempunctata TaxID=41139 RepID=UPI001D07FA21|nr:protein scylla-like isoform X1 [Coccinella septempunctata]